MSLAILTALNAQMSEVWFKPKCYPGRMRPLLLLLAVALISCSSAPESKAPESTAPEAQTPPAQAPAPQPASASAQAYLDKAAAEPGAMKTGSGLVYRELRAGTGASPKASDTVKVNYRGTLVDGTEFDSSYKRNEPISFPLSGVIPCWTEGVQKMKVGGKSQLVCPSSIAYEDRGSPPVIPGGATLIFEVELLGIGPS
jgi:FKBP-type peptidyl-prolyl cis-trans isomerase FkpA